MEKQVISNASSLIFLAKLNIMHLAKNMFSKIFLPRQVFDEIIVKQSPEINIINKELNKFIEIVELKKVKEISVDLGEKSAISLCFEKDIKTFLSDDKRARKYAESLGIDVIGVIGILIWNFEQNKINKQELLEIINKLIENDFYISSDLYAEIIGYVN